MGGARDASAAGRCSSRGANTASNKTTTATATVVIQRVRLCAGRVCLRTQGIREWVDDDDLRARISQRRGVLYAFTVAPLRRSENDAYMPIPECILYVAR